MSGDGRFRCSTLLALAAFSSAAVAAPDSPYPEGARFGESEFRNGLKERGLTDLLALHLREHPPNDAVEAGLLARDVKLTESADPSRSTAERAAALTEANRLLDALIEEHSADARVREWQMELAQSLLHVEAEATISSILYRGETPAERQALAAVMDRAVQVLQDLHAFSSLEYDALDQLPAREYDRREASGQIEKLESELAKSEYMLAWARFYRALVRSPDEPERLGELQTVLKYLADRSGLLATPHSETHFQAQALLLAGMSLRQLGDHGPARSALGEAIDVVGNLFDDAERGDLQWVVTLARIELVRSFRDKGSFANATEALDLFRQEVRRSAPNDFGMAMIIALLERSIYRAEADRFDERGRRIEASRLRERAVAGLSSLSSQSGAYRDEIYATLYELFGGDAETQSLSVMEQCALVAGLIGDAQKLANQIDSLHGAGAGVGDPEVIAVEARRGRRLDRAIEIAVPLVEAEPPLPANLRPQVAFNLGVAQYERGRRQDAARSFLRVARDHSRFFRGQEAATFAVQLAWELYQDRSLGARDDVRDLYHEALNVLTDTYADSESAKYWQFFLGQFLSGTGRYDAAAEAYANVDPDHERYYEAKYLGVEARGALLKEYAAANPERMSEIDRLFRPAIRAARQCLEEIDRAKGSVSDAARRRGLADLSARATVLTGELLSTPGVDRWARALEALASFEDHLPDQQALMGRVLRVRMIALESLGRHDEATQLIPQYIANDPSGAASTLQGLFLTLREETERHKRAGKTAEALDAAESATAIAAGLYDLAGQSAEGGHLFGRRAVYQLRLQLAEAALEAEAYERAAELFEQCVQEDSDQSPDGMPHDSRAMWGRAEAYYGLGQYAEALPLFNKVFRSTERGGELWWRALLRDGQCRTALEHEPEGIVKVIRQHKFFDPQMGGPQLRRQFDTLLAANERRVQDAER